MFGPPYRRCSSADDGLQEYRADSKDQAREKTEDVLPVRPQQPIQFPIPGARVNIERPLPGDKMKSEDVNKTLQTDGGTTNLAQLLNISVGGLILFTIPHNAATESAEQVRALSNCFRELAACGYVVYGLSEDPVPKLHDLTRRRSIPFRMMCDPEARLIDALGFSKRTRGTIPGAVVIDKEGKVLASLSGDPRTTVQAIWPILQSVESLEGTPTQEVGNPFESMATRAPTRSTLRSPAQSPEPAGHSDIFEDAFKDGYRVAKESVTSTPSALAEDEAAADISARDRRSEIQYRRTIALSNMHSRADQRSASVGNFDTRSVPNREDEEGFDSAEPGMFACRKSRRLTETTFSNLMRKIANSVRRGSGGGGTAMGGGKPDDVNTLSEDIELQGPATNSPYGDHSNHDEHGEGVPDV